MSHWSWGASDSHISWVYNEAGIAIPDRVPAMFPSNDLEGGRDYTDNLQGYIHLDRIIERVDEVVAEHPDHEISRYSRTPVIYEMGAIMVAHERSSNIRTAVEEGRLEPSWLETRVFQGLLYSGDWDVPIAR